MAQNIYDDGTFFAAYSDLPRSRSGLEGANEWPTLRDMLPPMHGRTVVDLGCGFGWFARWSIDAGASSVLGLDLSTNMLERAQRENGHPRIRYERADLDRLELPATTFDLAHSSLALHYLADLDRLMETVRASLTPGGWFVFSVEHPIFSAPSSPAFVADANGNEVWPLNHYLDEGERVTDWLASGVVKYHRLIATYLASLRRAGFVLRDLVEWGPTPEQVEANPEWAEARHRPWFLLVAAQIG